MLYLNNILTFVCLAFRDHGNEEEEHIDLEFFIVSLEFFPSLILEAPY